MLTVRQSQFGVAVTWIFVNTILMLVGASVTIVGFLVAFSPEGFCFTYQSEMRQALAEIYYPNLASQCIDFGEILDGEVKFTVIFLGFILFFFGLWAVVCAIWPRTWALAVYIVVISLLVIFLIGVLIAYFFAVDSENDYGAREFVREKVTETFLERYKGDNSSEDYSRFVNFIQRRYNCCGIDGTYSGVRNWNNIYRLPTAEGSPEKKFEVYEVPMSCCMQGQLRQCIADLETGSPLGEAWVKLGCFEGQLAADAEAVAKYISIALAVFSLFLAFSLTLAFIICTPILAAKNRRNKADFKSSADMFDNTAETSPGVEPTYEPEPPRPRHPPPIPKRPVQRYVQDSVTRWHSQFGSRFYDTQIFESYNQNQRNVPISAIEQQQQQQQQQQQRRRSSGNSNSRPPLPPR